MWKCIGFLCSSPHYSYLVFCGHKYNWKARKQQMSDVFSLHTERTDWLYFFEYNGKKQRLYCIQYSMTYHLFVSLPFFGLFLPLGHFRIWCSGERKVGAISFLFISLRSWNTYQVEILIILLAIQSTGDELYFGSISKYSSVEYISIRNGNTKKANHQCPWDTSDEMWERQGLLDSVVVISREL